MLLEICMRQDHALGDPCCVWNNTTIKSYKALLNLLSSNCTILTHSNSLPCCYKEIGLPDPTLCLQWHCQLPTKKCKPSGRADNNKTRRKLFFVSRYKLYCIFWYIDMICNYSTNIPFFMTAEKHHCDTDTICKWSVISISRMFRIYTEL